MDKNREKINEILVQLNECIDQYCEKCELTKGKHFSEKLGIKNSSNFTNKLNPYDDRKLNVDELLIIISEIKDYSYPVISLLAGMIDCNLDKKIDYKTSTIQNFKDILIQQGIHQGVLFQIVDEALSDGHIDAKEYNLVLGQIELLKTNLRTLEAKITNKHTRKD